MTSIRKGLAGTLLTAGALLAAGTGYSIAAADAGTAPPGPPPGMHHPPGPPGFFKELNLTADQKASMKAIMTAARPQMSSLHEQMRANHLKLMQTKPDDPNYGNVVAEVAQSNATLASQRTSQDAGVRTQMYAVLTPAQKTQLAALQAKWEAEPHPHHWGHHGGPGGGAGEDGQPPSPAT